jgi:hypothetical protein
MDFSKLVRRPDPSRLDCWLIYCDDVHVGTIALAVGRPSAAAEWQWRAGFIRAVRPGEMKTGTAASFELAEAAFQKLGWPSHPAAPKRTSRPYATTSNGPVASTARSTAANTFHFANRPGRTIGNGQSLTLQRDGARTARPGALAPARILSESALLGCNLDNELVFDERDRLLSDQFRAKPFHFDMTVRAARRFQVLSSALQTPPGAGATALRSLPW